MPGWAHLDRAVFLDWFVGQFEKRDCGHSSPCWVWLGEVCSVKGYARSNLPLRLTPGNPRIRVHRVAYEVLIAPIPEGYAADHLCRNRACVNPAHIEPVTAAENNRRALMVRATCPRGHARTPENLCRNGKYLMCRPCRNARARDQRAKRQLRQA